MHKLDSDFSVSCLTNLLTQLPTNLLTNLPQIDYVFTYLLTVMIIKATKKKIDSINF